MIVSLFFPGGYTPIPRIAKTEVRNGAAPGGGPGVSPGPGGTGGRPPGGHARQLDALAGLASAVLDPGPRCSRQPAVFELDPVGEARSACRRHLVTTVPGALTS